MTENKNDEVRRLKERGVFYVTCGLKEDAIATWEKVAARDPDDAEVAELLSRLRPPPERERRVIGIRSRAERVPAPEGPPEPADPARRTCQTRRTADGSEGSERPLG